jgi:hypothetical protein
MSLARKALIAGVYATVALTVTACGGGREVTNKTTGNSLVGTVKYGDEQLQFAMIMVTVGGQTSTGFIGDDGTYKVDNVGTGEAQLAVYPEPAKGNYNSKIMGESYKGPGAKGSGKVSVKWIDVPQKYHTPETSGLKATITAGENKHDIVIPK